jgi:hypothetical protein
MAIPIIKRIMNTSVHSVTRHTPAQLLFGPATNMDRYVIDHNPEASKMESCPLEWLKQQHAVQTAAIEVAKKLQTERDQKRINRPRGAMTVFPVGSLVLYDEGNPNTTAGPKNKLNMPKRGPYKVLAINEDEYLIEHLSSRHRKLVHVDTLVVFKRNQEKHQRKRPIRIAK